MARSLVVTRSVLLAAPAAEVWARASTPEGVMEELMPLVRMTFPASVAELKSADITMGETVCRCWLLAGGVVPFDRHSLAFEAIYDGPGADPLGFVEESTSWLQRQWRHERTVTALTDATCRVTDRITVVPRVAAAMSSVRRIVPAIFEHRHRRLERRWGAA